ncbi:MAG: hypothetical protein WAK24_10275 [Candidatus Acidiferrales bacterium]
METDADENSVARVYDKLQQQVPADTLTCVVKRLGDEVQTPFTCQGDQPIAQIFATNEHENGEDGHNQSACEKTQHALERLQGQYG